jgi:medium-chain acyl-[acyl-carrier-protein] hydrolase
VISETKRLSLFCFPYSGGSSSVYFPWAKEVPGFIELHAVELPGRWSRATEPVFRRMGPLVEALSEDLHPQLLTRPFAFFGHSLGALVCYELARFLQKRSMPQPVHLFASACPAPQCMHKWRYLHDLTDLELIEKLRVLGGMPSDVLGNAGLMRLLFPIIRADLEVCATYAYASGKRLQCPISVFGGRDDVTTSCEDLMAWKEHSAGDFMYRALRGGHFFLKTECHAIIGAISQDLATPIHGLSGVSWMR